MPNLLDDISTREQDPRRDPGAGGAAAGRERARRRSTPTSTTCRSSATTIRSAQFLADVASLQRIIVPYDLSLDQAATAAAKALGDTSGSLLEAKFQVRTFVKSPARRDRPVARERLLALALLAALRPGRGRGGAEATAADGRAAPPTLAAPDRRAASRRAAPRQRRGRHHGRPTAPRMNRRQPRWLTRSSRAREIEVMRETFAYGGGTARPVRLAVRQPRTAGPEFG